MAVPQSSNPKQMPVSQNFTFGQATGKPESSSTIKNRPTPNSGK